MATMLSEWEQLLAAARQQQQGPGGHSECAVGTTGAGAGVGVGAGACNNGTNGSAGASPRRSVVSPVYYQLPPRRAEGCPQEPRAYEQLYFDDFDKFDIGQSEDHRWNYFTDDESFIADDGSFRLTKSGLALDARRFTRTFPPVDGLIDAAGWLDHFKTFAILNCSFPVPDEGQIYVEAVMSNRTFNTNVFPTPPWDEAQIEAGLPNPAGDVRTAVSTVSVLDFETGLHLAHLINNQHHFALYERLPFSPDENTGMASAAFAGVYLVAARNQCDPLNDYAACGIGLDPRLGAFWYINGTQVHHQIKLGLPPAPAHTLYATTGPTGPLMPRCVHVGIGHLTYMDGIRQRDTAFLANEEQIRGLVRLSSLPYVAPYRPASPLRPLAAVVDACHGGSSGSFCDEHDGLADALFGDYAGPPGGRCVQQQQLETIVVPPQVACEFIVPNNDIAHRIYGQGAIANYQQLKVEYRF